MKLYIFGNNPELVLVERYENELCDKGEKWLYDAMEQKLTFLQKAILKKYGCRGYYPVEVCEASTDDIISAIIKKEKQG